MKISLTGINICVVPRWKAQYIKKVIVSIL